MKGRYYVGPIGGRISYEAARDILEKAHPQDWANACAALERGESPKVVGRYMDPADAPDKGHG